VGNVFQHSTHVKTKQIIEVILMKGFNNSRFISVGLILNLISLGSDNILN
jgi:hypothetical protein